MADLKTLLGALEQVFELEAAFHDGQLAVYRSGRPVDELMDGMKQDVQNAAAGNTVGSYTCQSCDTCLDSDQELTDHVNETGHRSAIQVNRRGCQ